MFLEHLPRGSFHDSCPMLITQIRKLRPRILALQHIVKIQSFLALCHCLDYFFFQAVKINEVVLCLVWICYILLITRNKRALSPGPPFNMHLQLLNSSHLSCFVRRAPLSCYYNATHIPAFSSVNLTGMLYTKPYFIIQLIALFRCIFRVPFSPHSIYPPCFFLLLGPYGFKFQTKLVLAIYNLTTWLLNRMARVRFPCYSEGQTILWGDWDFIWLLTTSEIYFLWVPMLSKHMLVLGAQ